MTRKHADRKWWKVSFEPRPSPRQSYNVEPSPPAAVLRAGSIPVVLMLGKFWVFSGCLFTK